MMSSRTDGVSRTAGRRPSALEGHECSTSDPLVVVSSHRSSGDKKSVRGSWMRGPSCAFHGFFFSDLAVTLRCVRMMPHSTAQHRGAWATMAGRAL
jgi:hypothetical protein